MRVGFPWSAPWRGTLLTVAVSADTQQENLVGAVVLPILVTPASENEERRRAVRIEDEVHAVAASPRRERATFRVHLRP